MCVRAFWSVIVSGVSAFDVKTHGSTAFDKQVESVVDSSARQSGVDGVERTKDFVYGRVGAVFHQIAQNGYSLC